MYKMKDEYLTGIPMIDEEHGRLFEIAQSIYELQQEEFISDKYDNLKIILEELKEYTLTHLDHEEAYMQSINYKRFFMQKVEHDRFRDQIEDMNFQLIDESSDEMITDVLNMITNWLVDHIFENDKLIGQP
ncbi:MAG: hemerythrin domain-containing protein [Eubacteriales bacterium]